MEEGGVAEEMGDMVVDFVVTRNALIRHREI